MYLDFVNRQAFVFHNSPSHPSLSSISLREAREILPSSKLNHCNLVRTAITRRAAFWVLKAPNLPVFLDICRIMAGFQFPSVPNDRKQRVVRCLILSTLEYLHYCRCRKEAMQPTLICHFRGGVSLLYSENRSRIWWWIWTCRALQKLWSWFRASTMISKCAGISSRIKAMFRVRYQQML